jgi:hypothetical protein
MNSESSKLRQKEAAHSQQAERQGSAQAPLEFASVEEMLRHDSGQNPVPPEVGDRLGHSIAAEPKPTMSWLRKLFR